jgi:hypothetical protein
LDLQTRRIEEDCHNISEASKHIEIQTDITEAEMEHFGDKLADRATNTIRIGFLNINRVPGSAAHQKTKKY